MAGVTVEQRPFRGESGDGVDIAAAEVARIVEACDFGRALDGNDRRQPVSGAQRLSGGGKRQP